MTDSPYTLLDRKVYIPPTFGRPVENASDALESAAALLQEEGRWTKSNWYSHHDPSMEEYKDDPFCNGWASCAEGALMIVTGGMVKYCLTESYEDDDLPDLDEIDWDVDMMTDGLRSMRDPKMQAIYDQAYKHLLDEVNWRTSSYYDRTELVYGHRYYWDQVYGYNDKAGVTRDDVVAAMQQAARVARGEQRIDETVDEPAATDA